MRGISAEFVGELQHYPEAIRGVLEGKYQLLFISPWPDSMLRNPQLREMVLS